MCCLHAFHHHPQPQPQTTTTLPSIITNIAKEFAKIISFSFIYYPQSKVVVQKNDNNNKNEHYF